MKYALYQIDTFTDMVFGGNPACVVPLDDWLPDDLLLKIARENAVAETAFCVERGKKIQLRWFTPEIEMDLCGHATLATAHCVKSILEFETDEFVFETRSGDLLVRVEEGLYKMDFPSRVPVVEELPIAISNSLNLPPREVLKSRDYFLVYDDETAVRNIEIDRHWFDQIDLGTGGVIVTAVGDNCDFVSRFFTPKASVFEDPVTGSAHCSLIPYWSKKLGKRILHAKQVSQRMGELYCEDKGERVIISGKAKTFSIGHFWVE